jgi:phosphoribosylformimino-5-aminoimidazole carboxamide ribotide isomerase
VKVIPAVDVLDGRCVRLIQGDYSRRIYYKGVVEAAEEYRLLGATELHLVDLNAARSGEASSDELVASVLAMSELAVEVGGGIRSRSVAERYFALGAERIVVGSSIVDDFALFRELCQAYPGRVVASLDYRREAGQRYLATHGWEDGSDLPLLEGCALVVEAGCRRVLATDVSRDGMMEGTDLDTYEEILHSFDVELIASGGVGSIHDLERVDSLEVSGRGIYGVVVGRAFFEGRIDVAEALRRWSR